MILTPFPMPLARRWTGPLTVLCLAAWSAMAQPASNRPNLFQLLTNVQPAQAQAQVPNLPQEVESTRFSLSEDGFLRYVGAPPGQQFSPGVAFPGPPEVQARGFLKQHAARFGASSAAIDFALLKKRERPNRQYVRFAQTYAGIPVFAAQVTVQLNPQGGVECVLSDIARDLSPLDQKRLSLTPTVAPGEARARVRQAYAARVPLNHLQSTPPRLNLFAPSVVGDPGDLQLVWEMTVWSENSPALHEQILLDAHTGQTVRQYSLQWSALNREVYDANNSTNNPGTLRRSEGDGPSGIADVDAIYLALGDTDHFYRNQFGRDGINGWGMTASATARYCDPSAICPWDNAMWSRDRMYFGDGKIGDDIVGHEFTHGVTFAESSLLYTNASGAINESLSDIFGEFIDLTNGRGNDDATNRWIIGEDNFDGPIRDMAFPLNFRNPDRLDSPFYQPSSNTSDHGGVHRNSGVNNKLCYLLTDGDTFNNETVTGMGINRIAALYYEVNVNLLSSGSDWTDLYNAMRQAAVNFNWSLEDRNNLHRACAAVAIARPNTLYVDKTSACLIPDGNRECTVGFGGPFHSLADGVDGAAAGDHLMIRNGSYDEQFLIRKNLRLQPYDGVVTLGK